MSLLYHTHQYQSRNHLEFLVYPTYRKSHSSHRHFGKLLGVGNTVKLFDALANGSKEHQFLDDGGATGTTKQAIKDEIYEITHRPEYMDDTKNKLLFARVTKLYEQLVPG
jgi:hypothetical protein